MSKNVLISRGGIKITKQHALKVQADQINHYAKIYGDHIRQKIADATNADALADDIEYDIATINKYIPRGAMIEALIPEKVEQERKFEEGMKKLFE